MNIKSKNRYWFMAPVLALVIAILTCVVIVSRNKPTGGFEYFLLGIIFIWFFLLFTFVLNPIFNPD